MTKREFIMNELMVPGFIESMTAGGMLEETEETGKSELIFELPGQGNLWIKNVDKKKTDILYFKTGSTLSMFKRVDHIVFEHLEENIWRLHLIEMKSGVDADKWIEIKGKFRASYLVAQGIAAMLEMDIAETCMYTTYERVKFVHSSTMPSSRRVRTGTRMIRPEEEWNGGRFGLNYGERMGFKHYPIQMTRDVRGVLVGRQRVPGKRA